MAKPPGREGERRGDGEGCGEIEGPSRAAKATAHDASVVLSRLVSSRLVRSTCLPLVASVCKRCDGFRCRCGLEVRGGKIKTGATRCRQDKALDRLGEDEEMRRTGPDQTRTRTSVGARNLR
jgi:hypothetical protein